VEKVVADITKKLADKDLARLFENCFPNTLDTTIRWHSTDAKNPQTFIITGDM
jgi:meiotically up-regulated gene 157 (Mug157) protein